MAHRIRWLCCVALPSLARAGLLDGIKSAFNAVKDAVSDQDVEVAVDSHRWAWSINVETLTQQIQGGWCTGRPDDAYDLNATRKERRVNKVEKRMVDGKEHTLAEFVALYGPERRLAGDGRPYTYGEFVDYYGHKGGRADREWVVAKSTDQSAERMLAKERWEQGLQVDCTGDCCPYCYDEAEFDFWCQYALDRWTVSSKEEAAGDSAYPYWPDVSIEACEVPSLGCQRRGGTRQSFRVELTMTEKGADSKTYCDDRGIAFTDWQLLEAGSSYPARKRLAYGLLCSSIVIPDPWRKRRVANDNKAYTYEEFVDFYGQTAPAKWQAAHWAKNDEL